MSKNIEEAEVSREKTECVKGMDVMEVIRQILEEREYILNSIEQLVNLEGEKALALGNIVEFRERTNQQMLQTAVQESKERNYAAVKVKESILSNLQTALKEVLESDMDDQDRCEIISEIVAEMGSALFFKN